MKRLFWIILAVAIGIIIYSLSGEGDSSAYISSVQEKIETRKRYLQYNDQSPFNKFNVTYREPTYYPIDPKFKVVGRVEKITERKTLIIRNSDGKNETYIQFARVLFSMEGKDLSLLILKPVGFGASDVLFCGFADGTSGDTTYGGGRYLDVTIGKSDRVTLDFNLAYNPYCAYVDDYSCPLPPSENILPINLPVGEMDFKSKF